jgi:peroxiredoxin
MRAIKSHIINRVTRYLGFGFVLTLLVLPASGFANSEKLDLVKPKVQLPGPTFSATTLDGKHINLAELKGRHVMLHFWATFCIPCRKELPQLESFAEQCSSDKTSVITFAEDRGDPKIVTDFIEQIDLKLPVIHEPDGTVRKQYEIYALPMTYLLDENMKIMGRIVGERNWNSASVLEEMKSLGWQCKTSKI